jgi:hypothetical protein
MFKVAPLSSGFMLTSMIGFLISVLYIYPKFSESYGFAFAILFVIMFISSMISFVYAPVEEYPGVGMKKP